ncbi:MAG: hypothetical protein RJB02_636 [Pseudomonadota bacterium]
MPLDRKIDNQMRAWIFAFVGSAIVAVAAMFVPVRVWEMITGSTGISEMVPVAAAPLGDKARALIAFGLGAVTFIMLAAQTLRRPARSRTVADVADDVVANEPRMSSWNDAVFDLTEKADPEPSPSLVARLRGKLAAWAEARRDSSAIVTLEDLPKLRASDAHPDAPPRRPFSAGRDLEALAAEGEPVSTVSMFAREAQTISEAPIAPEAPEASIAEPIAEDEPMPLVDDSLDAGLEAELIEAAAIAESGEPHEEQLQAAAGISAHHDMAVKADAPVAVEAEVVASHADDLLATMVDRLEAALNARDAELARIEALARELAASQAVPTPQTDALKAIEAETVAVSRPAREAMLADVFVPDNAEEMDPALRSALETLHRTHSRMH